MVGYAGKFDFIRLIYKQFDLKKGF